MLHRLHKIQKTLTDLFLDALFVTNQHNVTYLTGLPGLSRDEREAFLLITRKKIFLFTYATCYGLYKDSNKHLFTLNLTPSRKLSTYLTEIVKKENLKTIGFEKAHLTLSDLYSLQSKVRVKFTETEKVVENQRIIKEEKEFISIKKAAKITDLAFDFIKKRVKKDISEKDLSLELEFFLKRKADGEAFSPIVAFNENAVIPHYLPSNSKKLKANSLILLDFGAKVGGYYSDMTRVIFFGTPEEKKIKTYQKVLEIQEHILKILKAGMKGSEIDKIARRFFTSFGLPHFPHGLGHGVGLAVHEAPRLKTDSQEILEENMVVTVEPGVYFEGLYGIRIEDLVVLKKDGVEILSKSPKALTVI